MSRFARLALVAALFQASLASGATPVDQLDDLSGRASAIMTLKTRDNFANQFEYDVTVRNLTSDPLEADSLIVVVDGIIDLAGKDATDRVEVVGFDGKTKEGKPYYLVPAQGSELSPFSESRPLTVRLRNPYYTILFTPSLKVRGQRKLPQAKDTEAVQSLTDALTKKGVLTKEEAAALNRRAPANQPAP
jgi:hypothetical protein